MFGADFTSIAELAELFHYAGLLAWCKTKRTSGGVESYRDMKAIALCILATEERCDPDELDENK